MRFLLYMLFGSQSKKEMSFGTTFLCLIFVVPDYFSKEKQMQASARLGLNLCRNMGSSTIGMKQELIQEARLLMRLSLRSRILIFNGEAIGLTKGYFDVRGQLHIRYMLPSCSSLPLYHHCSSTTTVPPKH